LLLQESVPVRAGLGEALVGMQLAVVLEFTTQPLEVLRELEELRDSHRLLF
jgi:hypothetical protein